MEDLDVWLLIPESDDDWLCPDCIKPGEARVFADYWRKIVDVTPLGDASDPRGDPL